MKTITLSVLGLGLVAGSFTVKAQNAPPSWLKPAHVIVVMEENYSYSDIIENGYGNLAPNFVALSKGTLPNANNVASFTQFYAITHPSEPNYLELFSGSNQGITADESGSNGPFNDCNLGSSMIQAKHTFIGYSEDQPSLGWINGDAPPYYTKHCPWINWIGVNTNPDTIPVTSDVPYSYEGGYTSGPIFPDSNHYSSLPTMAWVIPNITNDMHDPSTSPTTAIPTGDNWFKAQMMPLVRWCNDPKNNSILIVTWDEDDELHSNNIPLMICSGLINAGQYTTKATLYDLLKTMEDMYGLTECGSSSSSSGAVDLPNSLWNVTAVNSINQPADEVAVWPNPAKNELNVKLTVTGDDKANIGLYDITGRMVKETPADLKSGANTFTISTSDVSNGVYFLKIAGEKINLCEKIVVGK
ncbi:MAG: alkaline phosphatase family protein [Bacteroidia bacterium]